VVVVWEIFGIERHCVKLRDCFTSFAMTVRVKSLQSFAMTEIL